MASKVVAGRPLMYPAPQKGAVLLVSLVMLLILTLIGMSAIGITTLDTKVANNSRDRQMAFAGAESALNVGGKELSPSASFPNSSTPGYLTSTQTDGWWKSAASTWWSSNGNALTVFNGRTDGTKPQYVIEPPQTSQTNGAGQLVNDISLGSIKPVTKYYRLTTRGVGPGGAEVMLQAVYAKKQYINTP